jgi:hypothetical protein
MELTMKAKTDENGGGYLPHMSEWFAIDLRLTDGTDLRSKVTHPAGVIALLQDLATRTDVAECVVYAWDASVGKYEVYDLD